MAEIRAIDGGKKKTPPEPEFTRMFCGECGFALWHYEIADSGDGFRLMCASCGLEMGEDEGE